MVPYAISTSSSPSSFKSVYIFLSDLLKLPCPSVGSSSFTTIMFSHLLLSQKSLHGFQEAYAHCQGHCCPSSCFVSIIKITRLTSVSICNFWRGYKYPPKAGYQAKIFNKVVLSKLFLICDQQILNLKCRDLAYHVDIVSFRHSPKEYIPADAHQKS